MKDETKTKEQLISELAELRQRTAELEASEAVHRQTADDLRSQREFSEGLIASMMDGFSVLDANGIHINVNSALCEMTGFSRDELIGVGPPHPYWPPEEYDKINATFQKTLGHEFEEFELIFMRRNGERFPVILSPSEVKDEHGNTISYLATIKDISELKQTEEELKKSRNRLEEKVYERTVELGRINEQLRKEITERKQAEELFRTLSESSPVGIYIVQDGKFQFVNSQFQRYTGYSENELLGMESLQLVIPEDRNVVKRNAMNMLKGKRSSPYEYKIANKRGEVRWILETVASVQYGGRQATLGNYMDITERKQTEEALRQSEERYRTILEEMEDGYYEVDLAGNYTSFNDATCRAYGYSREEMMGMNYRVYTPKEETERVYKTYNQIYRTGKPNKGFTYEVIRKDGSTGFGELAAFPLRNQEGKIIGFRGVSRDVTERKRMEEERRELERKAQLASRLATVGEMASGIAHEINNPLTGVIGYAQLLMQRQDIPEDAKKDLKVINDGGQRVAGIVSKMLTFARQYKPQRDYVSINDLIANTLALRAYELETHNIKVITHLDPELPATIADGGQLQQVFLNLIVNAETEMDLAHGKGRLSIKTEKIDDTIRISFKDDGAGISKENMDKIFNPFFTTREVGQGTGLGLSMCHGIIAEHNGRIYAESKSGKGATFVVELPIVTRPEQLELAEPEVEEAEEAAKAKILVVDDEPTVLSLVSRVLTGEGHEVETIDNADDALEMIESKRYRLILLDIKMPGMSGTELYKRIHKIAPSLARRIVFITGDVIGARITAFLSSTKAHYIMKPFDAEQLKRAVNRILTA